MTDINKETAEQLRERLDEREKLKNDFLESLNKRRDFHDLSWVYSNYLDRYINLKTDYGRNMYRLHHPYEFCRYEKYLIETLNFLSEEELAWALTHVAIYSKRNNKDPSFDDIKSSVDQAIEAKERAEKSKKEEIKKCNLYLK